MFCRPHPPARIPVAQFLTLVLLGVFSLFPVLAADRPNYLLLIADDLNWRDLGCVGNPDVKTPNLDRLAGEGMALRGMFTPAPTCSPCRHALYTGLFPVRSGAYPNHTRAYDGTASIFTHLKARGYRVGLLGKSHVGPPATFPFEILGGSADDTAALAAFINRDQSQPWLAVLASNDPHSPWNRGPTNAFDPAKIKIPPSLHDNGVTRTNLANYYAEIARLDAQIGAALQALDASGQAANTLVIFVSEQGSSFPYGGKWSLYDTGIRVSAFARWPGRIKPGTASDALLQYVDVPPTLLEAAGVDPAKIDTGCPDAYGRRGFDGRSFLRVLQGESNQLRDYVFAEHTTIGINGFKQPYPMRAVRDARYKLIRNLTPENEYWINGIHGTDVFESWERDAAQNPALAARVKWLSHRPGVELYDLETDPYETKNLADDTRFAGIKARLSRELDAWIAQQGDKGFETELKAKSRQGKGDGAGRRSKPDPDADPADGASTPPANAVKSIAPRKEEPPPPVVDPGAVGGPPSDAIVLFDGKDLSRFRGQRTPEPQWNVADGVMESTPPGGIFSKEEFGDCQLHVEWAAPAVAKGSGQGRGNSGVYLMGRYEIQVLDSYDNPTYPNGQCGAFYGHNPPLVNVCRQPGEWQAFDIIFHAPRRLATGQVQPGSFTVMQNGVLIQDHVPVGEQSTRAAPLKGFAEQGPLYLQDHRNPVRFRNVWIRKLNASVP